MRPLGVAERSKDAGGRGPDRSQASEPWPGDDPLTELYAAHWASLVRLAWLLVHDQGRAEEIVQDVFIASHPRMGQLREAGNALAYLRRAVVNGCRSTFRHQQVENRWLRSEAGAAEALGRRSVDSAETDVIRQSEGGTLLAALSRLPERQREVLVLRYYSDLSEQQIAEALEISTGTVKSHAHRGLTALRDALGGSHDAS
ncbi:MAG: SigE family RNA polymerase sigma factor [Lapillicoccus sp.]